MSTDRTKINTYTTLYQSESHDSSDLIVLCPWLGASQKHISKYVALYQDLAPRTPILLIESSVLTVTPPYPIQRRMLSDAVSIVQRTLATRSETKTDAKILIHTFSNGGSNSAAQLLLAYHEKVGRPIPLQGFVIDSAPAKGGYWKSYNAIMLSLPRTLLFNLIGWIVAHSVPGWMYLNAAMGRYPAFETVIRDTLLDGALTTGRRREGGQGEKRIAYIWSKEDKIMEWRDIIEHAEEARGRGWESESVEFEGSPHCGHLLIDRKRYVKVVEEMWLK